MHAAAGNLKKVSLELGGKSPVLVYPDANLETAIPGVAMAAFMLQGQNCVCGGTRVGEQGYFVAPTVYTDCTPDMRIVREEIFGPVMAIQTFDRETPEELAARANDTNYGLSASIWTRALRTAHTMSRLIDAGQVGVTRHAAMDPSMPFGGFKQSGWGREFGADALELYLRTKAVTVTWD